MDGDLKQRPQKNVGTILRLIAATSLLVAALGGLFLLIWLFHTATFLPNWLAVMLRILCVAAMLFCIAFYKCYLSGYKSNN